MPGSLRRKYPKLRREKAKNTNIIITASYTVAKKPRTNLMSYRKGRITKLFEGILHGRENDVSKIGNTKGKYALYLLLSKPTPNSYINGMISIIPKLRQGGILSLLR